MSRMLRQSLVAYAAPLCETVAPIPEPRGTEVLIRIARCGVCHSDVHMQDGYFRLGEDKRLDVTGGRTLPFTLGHEIAGTIERAGPDAAGATPGRAVAVYPWIGCGTCPACSVGDENICAVPQHLGIAVDGGFASHVIVPHPRYLLDHAPLDAGFAGALMCSGLTAFAAIRRLGDRAKRGPILLVGLGGVGMMGLALARALLPHSPLVADINADKRNRAVAAGASAAFDPADPDARKALLGATGGGVYAACDFVGSDRSLQFAAGALAKGGKVLVTGLIGGTFAMPAAIFPLKAMTVEGTMTGTLAEAEELMALARTGALAPIPMEERPLRQAQSALDDIRAGSVMGRVVLAMPSGELPDQAADEGRE